MELTEEQKLNGFSGLSRLYRIGLISKFPKLIDLHQISRIDGLKCYKLGNMIVKIDGNII